MTVNVENINRMIEAISAQAEPIRMIDWVGRNEPCGTTACLAGWANILRADVQGKLNADTGYLNGEYVNLSDQDAAARWMGLVDDDGNVDTRLFYRSAVDRLSPADRKTAAIALLTKLRDDGKVAWSDVVEFKTDEDGDTTVTLKV